MTVFYEPTVVRLKPTILWLGVRCANHSDIATQHTLKYSLYTVHPASQMLISNSMHTDKIIQAPLLCFILPCSDCFGHHSCVYLQVVLESNTQPIRVTVVMFLWNSVFRQLEQATTSKQFMTL